MNLLVLMLFLLLGVPFIPAIVEFIVRKDKGPRDVPEKTLREDEVETDIPRLERAREKARAKVAGKVIRIVGDASIPDGTEIDKHLVIHGDLILGKSCHVYGTVKAFGDVEIGEDSTVEGHILSEGKIRIGRNSVVKGVVDSTGDIVLEEKAVAGAVSTEKTVTLRLGAKIDKRIVPGTLKEDLRRLERPGPREELTVTAPEAANDSRKSQQESGKPIATEEKRAFSREPYYRSSEEEVFEGLLASKMREELRRKIRPDTTQSLDSEQKVHNEGRPRRTLLFLVMTLSALLLSEVAYYTPSLVILPQTALLFDVGIWLIPLILSVGFGSVTGFYTLTTLSQRRGSGEHDGAEPGAAAEHR